MPRHILPHAVGLLLSAPLFTGCGSQPTVVEAPRLTVPQSLLSCAGQPEPPQANADDATLAHWILDLAAAGDDCRARLAAVARTLGQ